MRGDCRIDLLTHILQLPGKNWASGARISPRESPHSGSSQHLLGPTQVALAPAMESDPAGKQRLFVLPGCDLGHPETSPRSRSQSSRDQLPRPHDSC